MTEQDQLVILHQGRDVWNQRRQEHHAFQPDFSGIGYFCSIFSLDYIVCSGRGVQSIPFPM